MLYDRWAGVIVSDMSFVLFLKGRDLKAFGFCELDDAGHSVDGPLGVDVELDAVGGCEGAIGLPYAITLVLILVVPGGVFFLRAEKAKELVSFRTQTDREDFLKFLKGFLRVFCDICFHNIEDKLAHLQTSVGGLSEEPA